MNEKRVPFDTALFFWQALDNLPVLGYNKENDLMFSSFPYFCIKYGGCFFSLTEGRFPYDQKIPPFHGT